MRQISLFLLLLLGLSACSSQYNIDGNSSLACLDGKKLYLRVPKTKGAAVNRVSIDSCVVVHGRFSFGGRVDSISLAEVYVDNQVLMPVVLEGGQLLLQVDNYAQTITGGPLNDRLSDFMTQRARLDNELWELDRTANRLLYSGKDMMQVTAMFASRQQALVEKIEHLENKFILDNINNVLGEDYFLKLTEQLPFPVMTKQLLTIIEQAPASFRRHPLIHRYLLAAGYVPAAAEKPQTAKTEDTAKTKDSVQLKK
jgi:hypothetical protein